MKVYDAKISYTVVREGIVAPANTAEKVVEYMNGAFDDFPEQEQFWVICLDRKNKPICRSRITIGTVSCALAHPREVFKIAILASASSIICVHNHPSGDPAPSSADINLTRNLRDAGNIIAIELLDHVVIGSTADDPNGNGFYSFRNAGMI